MGCDIHPHIEYTEYEDKDGNPMWWHFSDFFFTRDYGLFAHMAGVRNYDKVQPVAEPRGIPDDATFDTRDHFTLVVTDQRSDEPGYASRLDAARWVANNSSTWVTTPDVEHPRITHPDWHTPSWLTPDELAQAIERAEKTRSGKCAANVHAALAAMRAFESTGQQARLVFWFDN